MNHMYRALKTSHHLELSTAALLRMSLQCLKRNYCSSKALPADTQLSQGQEVLLQNMISATDVYDILSSIKLHHGIMNSRHLMFAFRAIFHLQKSDNSHMSNCEVIKNSGFRVLCESLKSNVRSLNTGEVLDALKTLSYLGVSPRSKLVQILLHILAKEINTLTMPQLLFLDFLIKDYESNPIVEALKVALPLVIDKNIEHKVDDTNILNISDLLHYSIKKKLSPSSQQFLMNKLINSKANIDFKSSKLILRSICDIQLQFDKIPQLFHQAIGVLLNNIHSCSHRDMILLISKLALRYSPENTFYYHEKLIDATAMLLIRQSADFENTVTFLNKLLEFGHVSSDLLNYVTDIVSKDPTTLRFCTAAQLFTLIGSYAVANYRPHNWMALEDHVLENAMGHLDCVHLPWVKFTRDLCCIGCWPTSIFEKLFSHDFLKKQVGCSHSCLRMLTLHADILSLHDWYTGPQLPQSFFHQAVDMCFKIDRQYPLAKYVSLAFGQEKVFTGVMTKLGHFMDYVIVFGNDWSSRCIKEPNNSSSSIFLEDLPYSPENRIVTLVYLSPDAYIVNTQKLRGQTKMTMNSLESCGVLVVPIKWTTWEEISEHDRVPFIRKIIQSRLQVEPSRQDFSSSN